ncbi:DUF4395 domain-containing protein [Microlunatus antarcticus]|uniref:Fatty acid desaturase n=1 Tax=Microlunatus antarcticus TaxID=53388 RepID=A0A7W5JVS1_9ACTN|nr:fatty acid desaturase [Microlunatus antarcticus]
MTTRELFSFPNPVDEHAARTVAAGVAVLAGLALATGWTWLVVLLAVGFAARTAAGPRFSLLGRLATQVVAPRLGMPKFVPGPPKRFAQSIGLVLTTVAAVAAYRFGALLLPTLLVAVLLLFALLESVLGFCAGCWLFGHLMRLGVIPADTCEACANVQQRYASSQA